MVSHKWLWLAVVAGIAQAEPLVGSAVGNADTLISEASKMFNQKKYPKAMELFFKATRANPGNLGTYAQLARASMLAKQLPKACYAYRVFLKASPDTPERKKVEAESDQCERQLKAMKAPPADPGPKYVEARAAFFAALDKGEILGPTGANHQLEQLVRDGFLGPDLGEMAQKLGAAAVSQADVVHTKALAYERLTSEQLKSARPLYQVATDVSTSPTDAHARVAFLDGLAELNAKEPKKAEASFAEASRGDPKNREYHYYRAVALVHAGDRPAALKVMESELRDDPRTATLRTALAVGQGADQGAADVEKLLFGTRFPAEK
jgi:tetratricopeptide (TPR) repeat protein